MRLEITINSEHDFVQSNIPWPYNILNFSPDDGGKRYDLLYFSYKSATKLRATKPEKKYILILNLWLEIK